ncbi:FAD-dependent monooxygenase [Amycolatopsis sp. CA-230715]|uniref:FAD-dependent monooxygenase n=1 Tax=Amycolatopsis sp. CA-230715 TaxID=2745196 RepID=UPI001C0091D4|nr:FAD-dependent monooxygenase [Amycolatopsis sp. CA-230715]QWF79308.1 Aklavinone 12-hydroxylase RdmE [Amycolatopsis sp. CA-230715]
MSDVPVVIVGGGTVGLSTAVFLGHHGVRSLVLERRKAPSAHPRALGVSPRTFEFFREAGLHEEVNAATVTSTALWKANARTVAEIDHSRAPAPSTAESAVSPENPRGHCPQDRLDAVLLPAARERGATVEFGAEVTAVDQDADGVTVTLADGRAIRAAYLVGADGVNTKVRHALGIGTSGPGEVGGTTMNILFAADLVGHFGSMPTMVEVRHPDASGMLLAVGEGRWVLHVPLPDGEEPTAERCLAWIRTAIGADVPVEVLNAMPWRATMRMATEFRRGRAFLVGDAARAITPLGALGLNTGVADAHNLAWKLAMVLAGTAGDGLLDTYHDERHAVAELVTRQAELRWENPPLHWDPAAAAGRAAVGMWHQPMVLMGYRYDSSAVVDPVTVVPSTEDVAVSLNGDAGSRLPHRWIAPGKSTVDLIGPGFAVLTGPGGEAWCEAARKNGLRATRLDADWAASVTLADDGALLVRPDGFIAWRTETAADPALLGKILAMVTSR